MSASTGVVHYPQANWMLTRHLQGERILIFESARDEKEKTMVGSDARALCFTHASHPDDYSPSTFRNLQARALREQQPQQSPQQPVPPPTQLPTQLSNNDDDDDPFDWDTTDAANNYDSEEEHGVVYNNLYHELDPHNVDWDDEDDVEDCFDNTEVNGDFYAGMSAVEIDALLHPEVRSGIAFFNE